MMFVFDPPNTEMGGHPPSAVRTDGGLLQDKGE